MSLLEARAHSGRAHLHRKGQSSGSFARWQGLRINAAQRGHRCVSVAATATAPQPRPRPQQQEQQQQEERPSPPPPPPQQRHPRVSNEDMSKTLTLANIRSSLIRQEDTIIFQLIERAQFARNLPVYLPEGVPVPGYDKSGRRYSLLEYVLRETEQLHGRVRRYTSPTEHPFFSDEVPPLVLPPISYPPVLAPYADSININDCIMKTYIEDILPAIVQDGDDGNYGSAATLDVLALQALSTRIHYGKFVAEAKFRARPELYTPLIKAQDAAALMDLLTDIPQEMRVVERVRVKAATFGQDIELPHADGAGGVGAGGGSAAALLALSAAAAAASMASMASQDLGGGDGSASGGEGAGGVGGAAMRFKVPYEALAVMYERIVMPLTKEVQVQYLLRRLDGE